MFLQINECSILLVHLFGKTPFSSKTHWSNYIFCCNHFDEATILVRLNAFLYNCNVLFMNELHLKNEWTIKKGEQYSTVHVNLVVWRLTVHLMTFLRNVLFSISYFLYVLWKIRFCSCFFLDCATLTLPNVVYFRNYNIIFTNYQARTHVLFMCQIHNIIEEVKLVIEPNIFTGNIMTI